MQLVSLSTGGGSDEDGELDPLESLGTIEHNAKVSEDRAVLAPGFKVLDERERRILHLRFFSGLTQSQIAAEIGISQMHVSRLIRRSLERSARRSPKSRSSLTLVHVHEWGSRPAGRSSSGTRSGRDVRRVPDRGRSGAHRRGALAARPRMRRASGSRPRFRPLSTRPGRWWGWCAASSTSAGSTDPDGALMGRHDHDRVRGGASGACGRARAGRRWAHGLPGRAGFPAREVIRRHGRVRAGARADVRVPLRISSATREEVRRPITPRD